MNSGGVYSAMQLTHFGLLQEKEENETLLSFVRFNFLSLWATLEVIFFPSVIIRLLNHTIKTC